MSEGADACALSRPPHEGEPAEIDLTPLAHTAERAGLGALEVKLVPPDRRRDAWFSWDARELRVSERVIDRLRPDDACVLLLNEVLVRRRRRGLRPLLALVAAAWTATLVLGVGASVDAELSGTWALGAAALAGFATAALAVAWPAAQQKGDDDTVAWLGEAETLCRALNSMDQDKLVFGDKRLTPRPDLHARAERLVQKHELRLAPEQRSVPPIERRGAQVIE